MIVSQLLTQIQHIEKEVDSLSDARCTLQMSFSVVTDQV